MVIGYANAPDKAGRYIDIEAHEVANHLGVKAYTGVDATSTRLQATKMNRIIHFACHGYFDREDPLNSGVHLADGIFTIRDWMKLRFAAELITVSACKTAVSEIRPGDELEGLAQAILNAGATSVLATLWETTSSTTQQWMMSFYKHAWAQQGKKKNDKATAFRLATLELMKQHQSEPYYWAPFVLIGSPF